MAVKVYKIEIDQGSDYVLDVQITDSLDAPIDLTGHVASAMIRRSELDPTPVATFTVTILDQSNPANLGKFRMTLTDAQTTALYVRPIDSFQSNLRQTTHYFYDMKTEVGGFTRRWLEGSVAVSPQVTY